MLFTDATGFLLENSAHFFPFSTFLLSNNFDAVPKSLMSLEAFDTF